MKNQNSKRTGTEAQRHKGTEAQRHKGTEVERLNAERCTLNAAIVAVTAAILSTTITVTVTAKSLYVIGDISGSPTPVRAYDISADGTLTFQADYGIPRFAWGAVGLAIDADNEYLFVTYEYSNIIQLVDSRTMKDRGSTSAPGATDLAGIVYDGPRKLLYCVDRRQNDLYAYNWEPHTATLTPVSGSPFALAGGATAWGIDLDIVNNLLYVANNSSTITVYSTSDWSLVRTIPVSRDVHSVAVDIKNGLLYCGGGWNNDNFFLTQYNLTTSMEAEVQVDSDGGVMGLTVDQTTGLVYMSTGRNNESGGDDILVYNASLNQIDIIYNIGNPTGIVIPIKDAGYNPLNLAKGIVGDIADELMPVGIGQTITYSITFDNNDYAISNVSIVDTLPVEVSFVTAEGDGIFGGYNTATHTYQWFYPSLPQGSKVNLDLVVRVKRNTAPDTIITNFVTIDSDQTPPTTRSIDAVAKYVGYQPLNLSKAIIGGVGEEIEPVFVGGIITYLICFDNNDNEDAVSNVRIVDTLPPEVSFLTADGDGGFGQYDPAAHTYTWSYPSLLVGSGKCSELVVRVKQDTAAGTIITNSVTIDSDQTPPTTASVDAVAQAISYNPLNLSKSIVGAVGDEIVPVLLGDAIRYRICFDNNDNDYSVTNVSIVDTLPAQVSFVAVDGDEVSGRYDAVAHTYTWSYPSLSPGANGCLELVVQINEGTATDTIISNFVTIDGDQTLPTVKSVHAITKAISYNPLNLTKSIVVAGPDGTPVEQIQCVSPGDAIKYRICFDNNDNDYAVTGVSIVDVLPTQVSFVTADAPDPVGGVVVGQYDSATHTYTWLYPVVLPQTSACLELVVQVKQDASPDTIITNSVTIDSNQTPPSTADVNVVTCGIPLQADLCIIPRVIKASQSGASGKILAILALPRGIRKSEIENTPLKLEQGSITASDQSVHETANRVKILAFFDKAEVINAAASYGKVKLRVVGKLNSGQSFVGEQFVQIAR
jgi:uncharacterized repeat protein (TIGR01451 family)